MIGWFRNLFSAIGTVLHGMELLSTFLVVHLIQTEKHSQNTSNIRTPAPVARYRGFHRFDLTTCIACDQCAKACPLTVFTLVRKRLQGAKAFR